MTYGMEPSTPTAEFITDEDVETDGEVDESVEILCR